MNMKNTINIIISLVAAACLAVSCNFLDVVPEGKATVSDLFKTHVQADEFVASLYSSHYLPSRNNSQAGMDLAGGGDIMSSFYGSVRYFTWKSLVYDNTETPSNTYQAIWSQDAASYPTGVRKYYVWECIRNAYIVLQHADNVSDATQAQKDAWKGEAYFLIGYCHQTMLEYYGPCPIIKELTSTSYSDKQPRQPYITVTQFISDMYNEAAKLLPSKRDASYLGRATKVLALTLKARAWLTAASPLINGNSEWYGNLKNPDGTNLIPTTYDKELWKKAMDAAQEAITEGEHSGYGLYQMSNASSDFQRGFEDYRAAFIGADGSSSSFNSKEILMGIVQSEYSMKNIAARRNRYVEGRGYPYNRDGFRGYFVPTFAAVANYLSVNGLPMDVDPLTKNLNLYSVAPGDSTALIHRNREPRFYASIGFDRGEYDADNETFILHMRHGEPNQNDMNVKNEYQSCTGYYCRKWIGKADTYNYDKKQFGHNEFEWPYVRFTEAYLDYAEAEAEYLGSLSAIGLKYLNIVRHRAGLPNFEDSWALVGGTPTGETLVNAIRQERMSEFCLEGRWYFDVRRWKIADDVLAKTPKAWNLAGETQEDFYKVVDVYEGDHIRTFSSPKNIWLSVPQDQININGNLVQNPGY